MATRKARVVLLVEVSDDHDDPTPTVGEIGDHVCAEINAAKGQHMPESWQHAVSATLESVRLFRRPVKKAKGKKPKAAEAVGWPSSHPGSQHGSSSDTE